MKNIVILGASGSIGRQALEAVRLNGDKFRIVGLSVNTDVGFLIRAAKEFGVKKVAVSDDASRKAAETALKAEGLKLVSVSELCRTEEADTVLSAVVGIAGLRPALEVLRAGKILALANKEAMITGGRFLKRAEKEYGGKIMPVDSEHSAVMQCLSQSSKCVKNIILTASGGAFRDLTAEELKNVTPERALLHPVWKMGKKVTVDSATLMNKGLEVIEAMYLFDISLDKIKVLQHRESIIHSLVEYDDGTMLAALSRPDMRIPIQLALSYPERYDAGVGGLDLASVGCLNFGAIDCEKFPCLKIALDAAGKGEAAIIALNAADEVAVKAFIDGKIAFTDISEVVGNTVERFSDMNVGCEEDVFNIDALASQYTISNLIREVR